MYMASTKGRLLLEHHGVVLQLEWKFEIILAKALVSVRKFDEGKDEMMPSEKRCPSPVCVSLCAWTRSTWQVDLLFSAEQDITTHLERIFFD